MVYEAQLKAAREDLAFCKGLLRQWNRYAAQDRKSAGRVFGPTAWEIEFWKGEVSFARKLQMRIIMDKYGHIK